MAQQERHQVEDGMKIGEKLLILKQEKDQSDRAFATAVGGHLSTISKILRRDENRKLTHEQLLRISRNWGVTVDSLIDDQRDMERVIPGLSQDELSLIQLIRNLGIEESRRRLILEPVPIDLLYRLIGGTDKGKNPIDWGQIEVRPAERLNQIGDGETKPRRTNNNTTNRG